MQRACRDCMSSQQTAAKKPEGPCMSRWQAGAPQGNRTEPWPAPFAQQAFEYSVHAGRDGRRPSGLQHPLNRQVQ